MKLQFNKSDLDKESFIAAHVIISSVIALVSVVFIVEVYWHWVFINLIWIISFLFYFRGKIITIDTEIVFATVVVVISFTVLIGGIILALHIGSLGA